MTHLQFELAQITNIAPGNMSRVASCSRLFRLVSITFKVIGNIKETVNSFPKSLTMTLYYREFNLKHLNYVGLIIFFFELCIYYCTC